MSLFGQYATAMRNQDGGKTVENYVFSVELIKRIRMELVNSDSNDEESEFFLDNLKYDKMNDHVEIHTFIAHHLYDYLQGHQL